MAHEMKPVSGKEALNVKVRRAHGGKEAFKMEENVKGKEALNVNETNKGKAALNVRVGVSGREALNVRPGSNVGREAGNIRPSSSGREAVYTRPNILGKAALNVAAGSNVKTWASGKAALNVREDGTLDIDPDEIEDFDMEKHGVIYLRTKEMIEKFASHRVGQFVLTKTERILRVTEDTTKWSIPPDESSIPLERPLPWIFFLPLIMLLRLVRFWLSVYTLFAGYRLVTPQLMIYYIQKKRRQLRGLRLRGLRAIRMRETKNNATHESNKSVTYFEHLRNLFLGFICRPEQFHEISVRRVIADGRGTANTMKPSIKRQRDDEDDDDDDDDGDDEDVGLTVSEMIDKYASKNSDYDSDYIPKADDSDNDSTTISASSCEDMASLPESEKIEKDRVKSPNAPVDEGHYKKEGDENSPPFSNTPKRDETEKGHIIEAGKEPDEMRKEKINGSGEAVQTPTEAPVKISTETVAQMPNEEPIKMPIEKTNETSVITQTQAPLKMKKETSVEVPIEEPIKSLTQVPAETPAQMPTAEATEMPIKEPMKTPSEMSTQESIKVATETPVERTLKTVAETPSENAPPMAAGSSTTKPNDMAASTHESSVFIKPSIPRPTKSANLIPSPEKENSHRTVSTQTAIELDWTVKIKTEIRHKKQSSKLEKFDCSINLTPASSAEDIFYSPMGSLQDFQSVFHTEPTAKGANGEGHTLTPKEAHHYKSSSTNTLDTLASGFQKKYHHQPNHNKHQNVKSFNKNRH